MTKNEILAIATHPVVATIGLRNLKFWAPDKITDAAIENCKECLVEEIISWGIAASTTQLEQQTVIEIDDAEEVNEDSSVSSMDRMATEVQQQMSQESAQTTTTMVQEPENSPSAIRKKAEEQVEMFFGAKFNWVTELEGVGCDLTPKDKKDLTKRGDVSLIVLKHFVLLDWWAKSSSAKKFDYIAPIAVSSLAMPDSNAFQERVFNRYEHMRDKRRSKLGKLLFEMKTLGCANKKLMKEAQHYMESVMSSAGDADEDNDPIKKVLSLLKSGNSEDESGTDDFLGNEDNEHIHDYE
jgi:hypothetical protein